MLTMEKNFFHTPVVVIMLKGTLVASGGEKKFNDIDIYYGTVWEKFVLAAAIMKLSTFVYCSIPIVTHGNIRCHTNFRSK